MTDRIQRDQQAPSFSVVSHEGVPIDLDEMVKTRRVWVAFFRYASCPMCNLRLHELSLAWPRLKTDDAELIAVYQSPPRSVTRWMSQRRPPLHLVADPEMKLFERYGLETSWLGIGHPSLALKAARCLQEGISLTAGKIEGPLHRLPADFLLERGGRVRELHYGKHIADHISLAKVARFLDEDDEGSFLEPPATPSML